MEHYRATSDEGHGDPHREPEPRYLDGDREADAVGTGRRGCLRARNDAGAPAGGHREGEGRRQVQGAQAEVFASHDTFIPARDCVEDLIDRQPIISCQIRQRFVALDPSTLDFRQVILTPLVAVVRIGRQWIGDAADLATGLTILVGNRIGRFPSSENLDVFAP